MDACLTSLVYPFFDRLTNLVSAAAGQAAPCGVTVDRLQNDGWMPGHDPLLVWDVRCLGNEGGVAQQRADHAELPQCGE